MKSDTQLQLVAAMEHGKAAWGTVGLCVEFTHLNGKQWINTLPVSQRHQNGGKLIIARKSNRHILYHCIDCLLIIKEGETQLSITTNLRSGVLSQVLQCIFCNFYYSQGYAFHLQVEGKRLWRLPKGMAKSLPHSKAVRAVRNEGSSSLYPCCTAPFLLRVG